ncbi:MAG: DNA-binding protein [Nostocaceae cyanobacterium]|nr:DNA-binding protein [Nostocaceae cyanobacterium]
MIVGTTQAASLLDISCQRLRQLLKQGRVRGAEKVGRSWQIPLFNGMPRIKKLKKKKGPPSTWRKQLPNSDKIIHVNQNQLKHNRKYKTNDPVIIVRQGTRTTYCHEVDINGPCRLVYRPQQQLKCGATLWIELEPSTDVITKDFPNLAVT